LRYHGEPDFAFLNIEDRIRPIPLGKYHLLFFDGQDLPALANGGEKGIGVERGLLLSCGSGAHCEQL
jgi:hypothetical protein